MAKGPSEFEMEGRPDGWERFENAVDAAIKSGPKHQTKAPSEKKLSKRNPAEARPRPRSGEKES